MSKWKHKDRRLSLICTIWFSFILSRIHGTYVIADKTSFAEAQHEEKQVMFPYIILLVWFHSGVTLHWGDHCFILGPVCWNLHEVCQAIFIVPQSRRLSIKNQCGSTSLHHFMKPDKQLSCKIHAQPRLDLNCLPRTKLLLMYLYWSHRCWCHCMLENWFKLAICVPQEEQF